jgi:hypothetical protein
MGRAADEKLLRLRKGLVRFGCASGLAVSGMTAEEWNAAWDAKLARTDDVPF